MHNVYLFQPQYTTVVNNKVNNWIPYSVGTLWSYTQQFPDIKNAFVLKDLIFKRENPTQLLARLDNPSLCGFSCYLWNKNYCLSIAKQIKQQWPKCVIVFGGPEVSGKMAQHDFIDAIILGEGEENLVDVMRNILDNKQPDLFLPKKRLQELDVPSPYLTGVFDDIMANNPEVMWAMTLETNRGCPYSCTFCDWGSLTYSKVKRFNLEKIASEIEWIRNRPISYVYLADANFGMFKERDLEIARMLRSATDGSTVDLVSVQNAKQSTEIAFEIGRVLGSKYAGVAIAMQSMHDDTLDAIKRKNLPTNNLKHLLELSVQYQIPTYTEMILGMPNETKASWQTGMSQLLELGQHNSIEMWFTQLLENSELAQPASRARYGLTSVISKNYISLKKHDDWQDIDEETELISSTNTMPLMDMVDSYMFGWMIIQLHIAGYSQIIAKYARFANNIDYEKFYVTLLEHIKTDPLFQEHYNYVRESAVKFLQTGEVNDDASGHMLHSVSAPWLYDRRDAVFQFVFAVANTISPVPDWVLRLQRAFIHNSACDYPLHVTGDYNILGQVATVTHYVIDTKITKDLASFGAASIRRKGLLKNIISIGVDTAA